MRMARNIYHRRDGWYEGRYANGYDINGKTKYRSVFGRTYAEVKEKLKLAKAVTVVPSVAPLATATPQTTIEAVAVHLETAKLRLKPSTLGVYKRYLDIYIEPYFRKMCCNALTTEISQKFLGRLLENGLSVITAQSIFNLLRTSVKGENHEAFYVKFPQNVRKPVEYLAKDEQRQLEETAKQCGIDNYIAIMLCLYTGIRIGDVCGLKWSDIDFGCGTLYVNRTMQRIRADKESKTELVFLAPKSTTSTREIPLPDFLLEILRAFKQTTQTEYVVNCKKKPIEPRTLQNRFKRILEKTEVKDVCWHTMRHTFATRELETGFDVKSLSEILGHGSATVTLKKEMGSSIPLSINS